MFNRVLNTPLLLTIKYLQDIRKVDRKKYNIGPENMVSPYSFVDSAKVNEYRHCVNNSCRKKQKQSARGILRKKCSENKQQIYRRTPMPKRNFLKSHFAMDVLLLICCIFSEHFLLRTPLGDCVRKRLKSGSHLLKKFVLLFV